MNDAFLGELGAEPNVATCNVCPIDRQQRRPPAGLLLSAVQGADIDRQQAPALSSNASTRQ